MNFWTGLILGIIIGWLVEWIIDWLFWRRDAEEAELSVEERLAASAELDADWNQQLANAETEYQDRLRAVEEEWQSRLNLNEQQWQSQFSTLEKDNADLRAQLAGLTATTVGAAGMALADEEAEEEAAFIAMGEASFVDEMIVAERDLEIDTPDVVELEEAWEEGEAAVEASDLSRLDEMNSDIAERLHLAGIDSVDELAAADSASLSVALGMDTDETEEWIDRAVAAIPEDIAQPAVGEEAILDVDAAPLPYEDDMTRVRGIGPKYAALLAESGITSYEDLAAATPDQLRDIIKPSVMQQINFESWSSQAVALANTRKVRAGDDLTDLEGIGAVYATKLREQGIVSFADLAAADEATLSAIINAPAWRRINFSDWIAQAKLAAAGDKIALQELQSRLFKRGGDNLSLIHGMGGRSVAALQAANIDSFAALAAATPQQIESALRDAGVRGGYDYEAWINEAGLRAAGKRIPSPRARATQIVACPQDLSAVEGVGTVFEERLYAAGIGTYWSLAELPDEELSAILDAHTGVDLHAIKSSAMKLAVETNSQGRMWNGTPPDDFDVLEGLGEVYERRLYEAGICTYEALAATSPERLAEICMAPAMNAPNYAAWISTAVNLSSTGRGN